MSVPTEIAPATPSTPAPPAPAPAPAPSRQPRVVPPVWEPSIPAPPAPAPAAKAPEATPAVTATDSSAATPPAPPAAPPAATPAPGSPDPDPTPNATPVVKPEWDVERQRISQQLTTTERQLAAEKTARAQLEAQLAEAKKAPPAPTEPAKPAPADKTTDSKGDLTAAQDNLKAAIAKLKSSSFVDPVEMAALLEPLLTNAQPAGQPASPQDLRAIVAEVLEEREQARQERERKAADEAKTLDAEKTAFVSQFDTAYPQHKGQGQELLAAAKATYDERYAGVPMTPELSQAKLDQIWNEVISSAKPTAPPEVKPAGAPAPAPAAPAKAPQPTQRPAPPTTQGTQTVPTGASSSRPARGMQRELPPVWVND